MIDQERDARPMTEERLVEIERAAGLGRFSNWIENQIVLDLVDQIRRLQDPQRPV